MITYFVTPIDRKGEDLCSLVEAVVFAGIGIVQYRTKQGVCEETIATAKRIHTITKRASIPLIINDYIELAYLSQAEGIHVGQGDMSIIEAKRLLPKASIFGLSLNYAEDYDRAVEQGVDEYVTYYAVSPLFSTQTKKCENEPFGLEALSLLRQKTHKQIIAIGGITTQNAYLAKEHGADGVALVSALCNIATVEERVAYLNGL